MQQQTTPFSLHSFDTTPSPDGRINAPSLLLAFAHIHGEAGTPTGGIYSAVVGRNNGPLLYVRMYMQKVWINFHQHRPHSRYIHLTPPRLRTGASMHLVYFWPSPTSMAWRERQRGASAVQWWVGTVCFYDVCIYAEGVDLFPSSCNNKRPHSRYIHLTPPRLRTGA
jgi:hypothetical protein